MPHAAEHSVVLGRPQTVEDALDGSCVRACVCPQVVDGSVGFVVTEHDYTEVCICNNVVLT